MLINIPDDVAQQLEDLAQQQGSSVEELLKRLLNQQMQAPATVTLIDMARNAREAGLASDQPVDTATRSRDILNSDYAEYLKRRIDHDDYHG